MSNRINAERLAEIKRLTRSDNLFQNGVDATTAMLRDLLDALEKAEAELSTLKAHLDEARDLLRKEGVNVGADGSVVTGIKRLAERADPPGWTPI